MSERLRFFFFDGLQSFRLVRRIDAQIEAVCAGGATEWAPVCELQNSSLEKTSPARLHDFIAGTTGAMTFTRIEHYSVTFKVRCAPFPHGRLKTNVATSAQSNKTLMAMAPGIMMPQRPKLFALHEAKRKFQVMMRAQEVHS